MMYTTDIDAETATNQLGITVDELKKIVTDLVENGMLKSAGEDELELTDKGKEYITEHMKDKLE